MYPYRPFRFPSGTRVRIRGLVSERGQTLNGMPAITRAFVNGRYRVRLEDGANLGVKPENLVDSFGVSGAFYVGCVDDSWPEFLLFQQHMRANGDEVRVIEGEELKEMRNLANRYWKVEEHHKKGTCITCMASAKGRIYTKEGFKEYEMTGICEECLTPPLTRRRRR